MTYVYRFDNWVSHMHLDGAKLRAKHWSIKKRPDEHPHATLVANERHLGPGEGLFRISFWKDEPTMRRWASSLRSGELIVMQRVRADHPFLQTFKKEVDDSLRDSAWLYWQVGRAEDDQRWSSDGIAKDDIDVLDFDGAWRRFNQSEIMEPEEHTFRKLGFGAYRYLYGGQAAATVFAKGQFVRLGGETQFVVLLVHPLCEAPRVYNEPQVLEHVFADIRRHAVNVPVEKCRLFIMDDAKYKFEPVHLAEVPLTQRHVVRRKNVRLFGVLPWGVVADGGWQPDLREALRWHASQSDLFTTITQAFALPLHSARVQRSKCLLDQLEGHQA